MNRWWLRAVVLVALVGAALTWQASRRPFHIERDIVQERLDLATPPLTTELSITQTLISTHANLSAIELLVARYEPEKALPRDATVTLTLTRADGPAKSASVTVSAAPLEHNQTLRFAFGPLPDSAGAHYAATLSSNGDHKVGFWHSAADAYQGGALTVDGEAKPGDLRMLSYYDYTLWEAVSEGSRLLAGLIPSLPAWIVLLALPGLVALSFWTPERELNGVAALALVICLSLATWPLLLLWTTAFRLPLSAQRVWAIALAMAATIAYREWRWRGLGRYWRSIRETTAGPELLVGGILLVVLAVRLLEVRNLVVPARVDSVHHTTVTQLICETGQVPSSGRPYVAIDDFHYHFGFHAVSAVLAWLTHTAPYQAVMLYGQVLNSLAPLTVAALASSLSRRRWAAPVAALAVGALAYMPAYFVSWGRYTELAGLVLLPMVFLALIWAMDRRRSGVHAIVLLGILVAGLAVTHYRVAVFLAAFWLCYPLLLAWRERGRRAFWGRCASVTAGVAGLVALAIAPWALRFALSILPSVGSRYGGWAAAEGYDTTFPWGLLEVGWSRILLYVSAAGLVWAVMRRRGAVAILALWVGLCLLIANLSWIGLPPIWLVNNTSVVIAFWLPVGLLCGWLVGDLAALLGAGLARLGPGSGTEAWLGTILAAAVVVMLGWGSWRLVDTVNPVTETVTADDMQALLWCRDNTPPDARFLINTRHWQGELRVGSDGGWWLPLIAHRAVNLPSVLYGQGTPEYRDAINALAQSVEEAGDLGAPELLDALYRNGITHVFVGTRGGRLMPKDLDASPAYELLYSYGSARVYALAPAAP